MLRMKTLSMIFDCLLDAPTSTLLLGKSVDIMLSEDPDLPTAKAFFRSAMAVTGVTPDRVTTDGHDSHPRAVRTEIGEHVRHRMSRYLNKTRAGTIAAARADVDLCLD